MGISALKRWAIDYLPWFWVVSGLCLILIYWGWIRPATVLGYTGDFCNDVVRQIQERNLRTLGALSFHSDLVMAPFGTSVPFMSWTIERDWIGAYLWRWVPSFPFLWVYYGVSLISSFAGVMFFLRKLGIQCLKSVTVLAIAVVLFHIPRHFKTWHHFEHLPLHWVYLSFFLDAWIWKRLFREGRWTLSSEVWRALFQLGVFCSTGYLWGVTVLEWLILHGFILFFVFRRRKTVDGKPGLRMNLDFGRAWIPALLCVGLAALEYRWFLPLLHEVRLFGPGAGTAPLGFRANPLMVFRPLWLTPSWLSTLDRSETVVSVGWFLVLPALGALWMVGRKRSGPGIGAIGPFLALLITGLFYMCGLFPQALRHLLPFMDYFRVASRWGLFLPMILGVIIALGWEELVRAVRSLAVRRGARVLGVLFLASTLVEASLLLRVPTDGLPPLSASMLDVLEKVRVAPGDTVLDLPFCVAGGNAVCSDEQCPHYPASIAASCFRQWHGKKSYGFYASRMLPAQCEIYHRAPYTSLFDAWKKERCLAPGEWDELCKYLGSQSALSAILVYPDLWKSMSVPACRKELERRLGAPLATSSFFTEGTRGSAGAVPTRVELFAPQCRPGLGLK